MTALYTLSCASRFLRDLRGKKRTLRTATFSIFILFFLSLPAQAQNNGLSYTTLGARKTENLGHMNYRKVYRDEEKPDADAQKPAPETQPAIDEAWEKYKALAAGTYEEKKPEKQQPKEEAKKEEPAATVGLAAILEEYRENKKKRSQLRTITVKPPELPKKPEAQTPLPMGEGGARHAETQ